MIKKIKVIMFVLVFILSTFNGARIYPNSQNEKHITLIKNVNLIPMTEEKVLKNQNVMIQNGKIISIVSSKYKIPKNVKIIDGKNGYLMPGMADMHVHLRGKCMVSDLSLYIGNGVTTIRDLDGTPYKVKWKKEIIDGKRFGPNLIISAPVIYGEEADLVSLENQYIKNNYDCMKIYSYVNKDVFYKIMEIAKRNNIYTVGHVPFKIGIEGVIKGGLNEIAHIEEITWFLADIDSTLDLKGAQWYRNLLWSFVKTYPSMFDPNKDKVKDMAKLKDRAKQIAKLIKANDISVCSTLICDENLMLKLTDLDKILASPGSKYLPPSFTENLEKGKDRHQQMFKGVEQVTKHIYQWCNLVFRELKQQNVPIVLGTDGGVVELASIPGFSVHRELQLMVDNGSSPFEALVTCTVNAAKIMGKMGKENNFGTIEKGQRADLVLLNNNPLDDIKNTRGIRAVMVRGQWFPKEKLQEKMDIKMTPISKILREVYSQKGIDAAVAEYHRIKIKNKYNNNYTFFEEELNTIGYNLLGAGETKDAIVVFKLNVKVFPEL